jgi:HSP20 family molecular chaperone IbpA
MSLDTQIAAKQKSDSPEGTERVSARAVYRPAVDIVETDTAVVLVADMPGVDEASTEVTLEKNVLGIRGAVHQPHYEGYVLAHCEYGVGDFERSFTVSDQIDRDGIEATMREGVLHVTLPKSKKAARQKIAVKSAT